MRVSVSSKIIFKRTLITCFNYDVFAIPKGTGSCKQTPKYRSLACEPTLLRGGAKPNVC